MAFAFYDLETTGTEPAFDQPLQFAAILTDERFNEVDRINLRCRLAPHILPNPTAMAITGVTPDDLVNPDLPSYLEFSQTIRTLIHKWTPATWVGYNTIKFDETFLRQMFYQTLQPDFYETQFNGNTRLDIMLAVEAVWAYEPLVLDWPEDQMGNPILRLDRLAPLNGFTDHDAHDALGDVKATIHLVQLIQSRAPDLWAEILANRDKHDVSERLASFAPLDLVLRYKGPPKITTGCLCGYSADNPNIAGFFDLEHGDPADYFEVDDEALTKVLSNSPKIIRGVSVNKVPNLFQTRNSDPELIRKAAQIADRPDFQKRIGQALAARLKTEEPAEGRPVENRIYDGFYSGADKSLLRSFQTADWAQRSEIVGQFADLRLQQLGRRLIAFEHPDTVDHRTKASALEYLNAKWRTPAEDKPKWTSFETAAADLDKIEAKRLLTPDALAAWRQFFDERQTRLESGDILQKSRHGAASGHGTPPRQTGKG